MAKQGRGNFSSVSFSIEWTSNPVNARLQRVRYRSFRATVSYKFNYAGNTSSQTVDTTTALQNRQTTHATRSAIADPTILEDITWSCSCEVVTTKTFCPHVGWAPLQPTCFMIFVSGTLSRSRVASSSLSSELIRLFWLADANGTTGNRSLEQNQRGRTARQNDLQEELCTAQGHDPPRKRAPWQAAEEVGGEEEEEVQLEERGEKYLRFLRDVRPRLHKTACSWDFSRLIAADAATEEAWRSRTGCDD